MVGRWLAAVAASALVWTSVSTAAEYDAAALQAAVEKSSEAFAEAFAQRDAKAIAALFTRDAEYVDSSGVVFHGRAAIEAEYAAAFEKSPKGKLNLDVIEIRPVAENVVVEEGVSTLYPEDESAASELRYTATHVKQGDGAWLMASVRELTSPALSAHERLKSLAWLLGKWREEVDGQVSSTEWKWTDDGNFLLASFTIRNQFGVALEGTHRIGWDAERKQFRSWIFDTAGGFADGWWSQNDAGSWSIQLSGLEASGQRRSLLLTYERAGDDALIITQDQRRVGEESLPSSAHRVVRTAPEPGQ